MQKKLRKIKILLADDSPSVIYGLKELLREFENLEIVGEASNGKLALELSKSLEPNIIILDLNMPKLSGLEVLKSLRSSNKDLIIIIYSINSSKYYRNKCKDLGCNYFFDKTSEIDLMMNTISHLS